MNNPSGEIAVADFQPSAADFLAETIAGLSQTPRTLPCKYFYDERGAELFGEICELPEYYITRTELAILSDYRAEISRSLGPRIQLIGLGTGAGTKTRILLEELEEPATYIPVDISREQLDESTGRFRKMFPRLEILPVAGDYLQSLELPTAKRERQRRVVYFPGSTIGNFEPQEAAKFLKRIARLCGPGGGLLIGVDLQKSADIIERAYNDSRGVTAKFNLNLLARANLELGANFDLSRWHHRAVYNPVDGRIEMNLISGDDQSVQIGDREFQFSRGEKIITEYSSKYSQDGFATLASAAGFEVGKLWTDDQKLFGVFYFVVR